MAHCDLARDDARRHRTATLVRHVHGVDAGEAREHDARKMTRRADAGGSHVEPARLRPGERDQLLHALCRDAGKHNEHAVRVDDQGDWGEVLQRIERELAVGERRNDHRARGADDQGVAVGCGAGPDLEADRPARAAAIVDHELLAERLRQLRRDDAGDGIERGPGRLRRDHPHRPAGIGLGNRGTGGDEHQQTRCYKRACHDCASTTGAGIVAQPRSSAPAGAANSVMRLRRHRRQRAAAQVVEVALPHERHGDRDEHSKQHDHRVDREVEPDE